MLLPTWGRGRQEENSGKSGEFILTLGTADQLSSKQFQAVFYLPSVVFGSCECFAATSMPYFPSKMLTKFLVSVTSCGNELFATAYGKCQHERERQQPRDRQNSGLECPPHVPVCPRQSSTLGNPSFLPCSGYNPLYKGQSKWKLQKELYQTLQLDRIFHISCPLCRLNAWVSEVHMNHSKSFPAQNANLA